MTRLPRAALLLAVAAAAPLIPDTPYLELVPQRAAWSGAWANNTLPSPWTELDACAPPSDGAAPALFLAADVSAGGRALALLACADGGLAEAASNTRLEVRGLPGGAARGFIAAGAARGVRLATNTLSAVAADGAALYGLACVLSDARCTATVLDVAHGLGSPLSALLVAADAADGAGGALVVGSGPGGTAVWALSAAGVAKRVWADASASYTTVAFSAARRELALGNASKLVLLDASAGAAPRAIPPRAATRWSAAVGAREEVLPLRRWLWATNVTTSAGGEIDDAIKALVYDDGEMPAGGHGSGNGTLWIGTPTGLHALYPNGTITRFGGAQGLPVANITALAVGPGVASAAPSRHVWIGTTLGLALLDPFADADVAGVPFAPRVSAAVAVGGDSSGGAIGAGAARWRYYAGPRHVPVLPDGASSARAAASAVSAGGLVLLPAAAAAAAGMHVKVGAGGERGMYSYGAAAPDAGVAFAAVRGGLAALQPQFWTLADKAAAWERYVRPHIYDGQANDCGYAGFGRSESCAWSPGANDGLWSAALLAGEAWRWAVTRAPDALNRTLELFSGMRALNEATGIRGLIARAAVGPAFTPAPSGGDWHKSTALPGWSWLGDASSDEVVGHVLAYPLVAATAVAAGDAKTAAAANTLIIDLARYITLNNFTLVDVTGRPTTWGRWDPAAVGTPYYPGDPTRSDNRGENSLEVLALLAAALRAAPPASADAALFRDAIVFLAVDQEYTANLANTRIVAPDDVNYSDDELELFSFYSLCFATEAGGPDDGLLAPIRAAALVGLRRAWYAAVGATRQAMYGTMVMACTGMVAEGGGAPPAPDAGAAATIAADVVWNLRGWALEAADWPVDNSARIDIVADASANRFGSVDTVDVLPMRERQQQRWNADPYGLSGGDGGGEADAGAFLCAFWAARWYGVVG